MELSLSDAQRETLKILAGNGGSATVRIVSKSLNVSSVYAWRLLQGLIDKGLVEKVEWGFYRLTPEGWRHLNAEG